MPYKYVHILFFLQRQNEDKIEEKRTEQDRSRTTESRGESR